MLSRVLSDLTFIILESHVLQSALRTHIWGTLLIQWLRCHTPNAGVPGSIPGQGARSHMQQLQQHHHINEYFFFNAYFVKAKVWLKSQAVKSSQQECVAIQSRPAFQPGWKQK